jgi:ABC-type transport system involved in cytochrome bd biosynthesis fused ATPase/permease subunit
VLAGLLNFATSGASVGLIARAGYLIAWAALVPKENGAAQPPMDMGY